MPQSRGCGLITPRHGDGTIHGVGVTCENSERARLSQHTCAGLLTRTRRASWTTHTALVLFHLRCPHGTGVSARSRSSARHGQGRQAHISSDSFLSSSSSSSSSPSDFFESSDFFASSASFFFAFSTSLRAFHFFAKASACGSARRRKPGPASATEGWPPRWFQLRGGSTPVQRQ